MRCPKTLSYSSMSLCESNPEEFYLRYLADRRPPRQPQEKPMAVGAAFDAYVKSALAWDLFGVKMSSQFEFGAIFESQVEPPNRDFGLRAGKHVWKAYKLCGAYGDLLNLLRQSVEPPRFEFSVESLIDGVPFMGKPDCRFVLDLGEGRIHCVWDWKVKGYCSKYGASPSKGYAVCLDGFISPKPSRSHGKEHNLYLATKFRGLTINAGYLETCHHEYADQLCIYGWMLGEKVGDETVVCGIEETVAKFMGEGNLPQLRYARHRARVKAEYQLKLRDRVKAVWEKCVTGHVFPELSREDNDARCAVLEDMANNQPAAASADDSWMDSVCQPSRWR